MYNFLLILLFILAACGKKAPEQKPEILSLQEMSDLATVEYTVTKIIKANDNKTWFKLGDRKILMSCEATIKAGVDLGSLTKNSYAIDGKNVHLQLPNPKVISISLPADKIKVEYQDVGVFRDPFKTQERDALAAQAETQIKNSVATLGILDQAKANTSLFVSNFLKQIGYESITITYADTSPKTSLQ